MGTGLRVFLVNDDGSLKRFPLARFERLFQHHAEERLPQYAGKRVRYAFVVVNLVNREPVEIIGIQYPILTFDSKGRIDAKVVDVEHRFLQKRFENRYLWEPTPEIEEAIVKAIFGQG
jgi:hypothetical protein